MSSIDDLFKKPALPSNKRKLEATRDPSQFTSSPHPSIYQQPSPDEIYKAAKLSSNGHVKSNGKSASVAEEEDGVEDGPSAPPEDEEDYGPDIPDDEEGRFFGGGVTQEENEILDYMEGQEEPSLAPEKYDGPWLRKLALNFEKRIAKNAELRAKFESEPEKFMGSEADLDTDIKALSILAEHAELFEDFAKLGCAGRLVGLLAHENTDIAIDAIEIISELTDEDVEVELEDWNSLVDAMIESDLLDLLVSNFSRFDERNESDRAGVFHALAVLEHLASREELADKIGKDTKILEWLLARIPKKETPVSQNKQNSAEILAILLQYSTPSCLKVCELNGVDLLLQILASYRKRNPEKGEEEEFFANVFDALARIVREPLGKDKFLEAEGVELCLIMLKEGKMSRPRALGMLDSALEGVTPSSTAVGMRLVEAAGLKTVFSLFMKNIDNKMTENVLGIFGSLLRLLPAESAERIRTLAKFVEKDYEKIGKLVKLRRQFSDRVKVVDEEIREEQKSLGPEEREEMIEVWESRRLDNGLIYLRCVDVVLAWLVAEDGGAEKKIRALLGERDEGLVDIRETLQDHLDSILDDPTKETMIKDMLSTLVQFLT